MKKAELSFERSSELKRTFIELSERWCRKNRLGMNDLAERCGVSMQYLSHIGRYGRVPSKPILTLLAFNLEVSDPKLLFRISGIKDPWPYDQGIGLRPPSPSESGLLNLSLDMKGFATVIREIVRSEIQPKRLEELLGNRALRVGLNRGQFFLFDKGSKDSEGFFPELMRSLALALHCDLEFVDVKHPHFIEMLSSGELDCYGPVYRTAPRLTQALYTKAFCSVPVAGLGRVKENSALSDLPLPKRLSELRKKDYMIAVHSDSMAHHFAETVLGVPRERIIPCELPEEALERIILSKLPRPAHLILTDLPFAMRSNKENSTDTVLLFEESDPEVLPFEDAIAVRSDWPSLLSILDQSIDLLRRGGALERLLEKNSSEYEGVISLR